MFDREIRYVVLKHTDVNEALTSIEIDILIALSLRIAMYRENAGKKPLQAVVVESDWPEYETVWKMLEERVNAA